MNLWELPKKVRLGGRDFEFYGDFRNILDVLSYFQNPDFPPFLQWQIALALFYKEPVPPQLQPEAMEYLALFINGGRSDRGLRQRLGRLVLRQRHPGLRKNA